MICVLLRYMCGGIIRFSGVGIVWNICFVILNFELWYG